MLPPNSQKSDCRDAVKQTDRSGEVLLQPVKQQQAAVDIGSRMSLC